LITVLIGVGWIAGRAQGTGPDFVIRVDAPEGKTNIECVSGCQLAWIERMDPSSVKPTSNAFYYGCSNASAGRCGSGRIGGWIKK
jgi:hypothetical protein